MKLAIISSGGVSSKKIAEEGKKYFKRVDNLIIKNIQILIETKDTQVLYEGKPLEKYDCVYIRGSYKYNLLQRTLTEILQGKAYIINSPESYTLAHDKLLTIVALQKNKVPVPTTYLTRSIEGAKKVLEQVDYPIIMKIPSGTQGKGVMFADSLESAKSILDTIEVLKQPYLIQEYIETGATDIRTIILGNKVIAAMKRKGPKREIRANIHMGGKGKAIELDEKTVEIAVNAAKSVGAEICGVDILESDKGPVVIEINLSPGLQGISEAVKEVNVAQKIAEYLYDRAKDFKAGRTKEEYGAVMKELKVKPAGAKEAEELINLDVKADRIKLPKEATTISGFLPEEEVILIIKKGKIIIKKLDIISEDLKK